MKKYFKWLLILVAAGVMLSVCTAPDNRSPQQKHTDQVEQMFNQFDGSCPALVSEVKKKLNDAESFEHVQTQYRDIPTDSLLMVQMKFRAKNAFGAMVLQQVDAKVHYDGTVTDLTLE